MVDSWVFLVLIISLVINTSSGKFRSTSIVEKRNFRRMPTSLYLTKRADSVSSNIPAVSADKVKLRVQFCGGWGYDRFFDALEEAINKEFPGMVELEPIMDIGVTGNFEITLMQTKQLLHSKMTQGLGKCESEDERKRLFSFIRIYLDYMKKKAAKQAAATK
jgi:selT/selW/selH-like putative selenoprotein